MNPVGTRSGPSTRVISATLAPFPPSSSRISRLPWSNGTIHLVVGGAVIGISSPIRASDGTE